MSSRFQPQAEDRDPSALVRGAAVWALSQLLDPAEFGRVRAIRLPVENEQPVRDEWEARQSPLVPAKAGTQTESVGR